MATISVEDAQVQLRQIIDNLAPGEEILISDHGSPLAKLIRTERTSWPCKAGSAKDRPHWMAPDFDAPLEEFKEYME